MGLFDGLFNGKKSKFEEVGDNLFDQVEKKFSETFDKPMTEKAISTINEAADRITESLEAMEKGEEVPVEFSGTEKKTELPDIDTLSKRWDSMIDAIEDRELSKYKLCPSCGEPMPAENEFCTNCGAKLPEKTLASRTCPYCGTENRYLALKCVQCGKDLPLITEGEETKGK